MKQLGVQLRQAHVLPQGLGPLPHAAFNYASPVRHHIHVRACGLWHCILREASTHDHGIVINRQAHNILFEAAASRQFVSDIPARQVPYALVQ